jgi:hypothetical protein
VRRAMNITISPSSRSGSAAGKGCATIFFSIFAIAGLVFTAFIVKAGFDTARPYFWDATDCVIEASSANDKGDSSEFNVRYAYRFNGRSYTGTRFSIGITSSMNTEKAQRAALRYAPGNGAVCYVNPKSPGESTLERGSLWILLTVLFPLIFVAIGVGGIIGVWRMKPPSAKPLSERHRAGAGGTIFLRIFGLVFMCAGGGAMYAMLIHPMLKEAAAAKWPQMPCEIISSRVASHRGSKGGSTYSVEVRYRYDFKGRAYTGTRYNFDAGSSSSRGWRAKAVANIPPRLKTLCYVNPDDPFEAVLSVKPSPDRWFGLIPGVFLIVGLFIFFKAPAMANRNASRTGLPADILPLLRRDAATGEVELKPATSPMTGCVVMLVIALFWNGIVWAILLNMPSGEWFPRIFLSIFALIGLGLIAGVVYQLLALYNPRPILTASAGAIPLGGTLDVRWRFTGNVRRLVHLDITLEGREEATYRRGTTTTTDRNVFAILKLTDTADREQIASGSAKVTIPRELIHTFTAPNNKIVWTLRLAGDIPKWPDVSAEFPITVLPRDASTLFQEQPPTT